MPMCRKPREQDRHSNLAFSVTLSHASSRTVTVDYATSNGSARPEPAPITPQPAAPSPSTQVTPPRPSRSRSWPTPTTRLSPTSAIVAGPPAVSVTDEGSGGSPDADNLQPQPGHAGRCHGYRRHRERRIVFRNTGGPTGRRPARWRRRQYSLRPASPTCQPTTTASNFTFQLNFSENVDAGYARIQNDAFTVSGGSIASASRITQGSNQGWNVEVNPTGNGSVTITLPETTDCNASGAICTDDSRKLSHPTSAIVAGPPAISVSDATVQEAQGAVLEFSVTLSHASSRTVTVDYATSDGTAVAGSDYTAASGKLTFNAGDTSQTVSVTVLTDSDDEGEETLTLTLSNPSQATLDDATGTGAIENGESSSGTQEDPPVVLLTASFANVPAAHDGAAFTFDLSFSSNVEAGYARIRDDAFNVTGGEIANAQRKSQGSNQNWTITVRPDGNAAMTITLPPTTDCGGAGAICTHDGRKLSASTSARVAGPE